MTDVERIDCGRDSGNNYCFEYQVCWTSMNSGPTLPARACTELFLNGLELTPPVGKKEGREGAKLSKSDGRVRRTHIYHRPDDGVIIRSRCRLSCRKV